MARCAYARCPNGPAAAQAGSIYCGGDCEVAHAEAQFNLMIAGAASDTADSGSATPAVVGASPTPHASAAGTGGTADSSKPQAVDSSASEVAKAEALFNLMLAGGAPADAPGPAKVPPATSRPAAAAATGGAEPSLASSAPASPQKDDLVSLSSSESEGEGGGGGGGAHRAGSKPHAPSATNKSTGTAATAKAKSTPGAPGTSSTGTAAAAASKVSSSAAAAALLKKLGATTTASSHAVRMSKMRTKHGSPAAAQRKTSAASKRTKSSTPFSIDALLQSPRTATKKRSQAAIVKATNATAATPAITVIDHDVQPAPPPARRSSFGRTARQTQRFDPVLAALMPQLATTKRPTTKAHPLVTTNHPAAAKAAAAAATAKAAVGAQESDEEDEALLALLEDAAQDEALLALLEDDSERERGVKGGLPRPAKAKKPKKKRRRSRLLSEAAQDAALLALLAEDEEAEASKKRQKTAAQEKASRSEGEQDVLDGEYAVEAILKKKREGLADLYWVKWVGWSTEHNTWEPREHLLSYTTMLANVDATFVQQSPNYAYERERALQKVTALRAKDSAQGAGDSTGADDKAAKRQKAMRDAMEAARKAKR